MSEILNINVSYSTQFGADSAIKHVVGMARIAGLLDRNTMILKVGRCDIMLVVDVKSFSVRLHHMARQAKGSLFRLLEVYRES
jgi:hypothetical protein